MNDLTPYVIPFYGGRQPDLFEIERRCMDRDGVVIDYLNRMLPNGSVIDIGAGNGFVAERVSDEGRVVVPLEPDARMIDLGKPLLWARGVGQSIPFHDNTFDAAYATWACFLPGAAHRIEALVEVSRVVKAGGPVLLVDNAGGDAFCALANRPIADDGSWYTARGFERSVLHTAFQFDSVAEARTLIGFYFGPEAATRVDETRIGFDVALYVGYAGAVGERP